LVRDADVVGDRRDDLLLPELVGERERGLRVEGGGAVGWVHGRGIVAAAAGPRAPLRSSGRRACARGRAPPTSRPRSAPPSHPRAASAAPPAPRPGPSA